jgi:hypothetical protein
VGEPIGLALALTLGILIGLGVSAVRAAQRAAALRAIAGANAGIARFWPAELPARSASDILAGVIRVYLGGLFYELPVLPRAASREWLRNLDAEFASLADDLEKAGNDSGAIMARLLTESDGLYTMLASYDQSHILPPMAEIDRTVTDIEILRAILEVWRAANPLAASLAEPMTPTSGTGPEQPSSPLTPTAGDLNTLSVV